MAKTTTKNTIKRPVTKNRSLNSDKKATVKAQAKADRTPKSKRGAARKLPSANKSIKSPSKSTANKIQTVKKSTAKQPKPNTKAKQLSHRRNITLPISRSTKLVISLQRSKPKKKKQNKTSAVFTSRQKLSKGLKKLSARKSQSVVSLAIILTGLAGSVYFGLQVAAAPQAPKLKAASSQGTTPIVPTQPAVRSLPYSQPTHMRVPSIGIDSDIMAVGLDKSGAVTVPDNYSISGWYNLGPSPGEVGPAVIVGHLDNVRGPAVFWRLHELTPGKIIEIDRADGKRAKFIVDAMKEYPQSDFPTQDVYGNIKHSGLRLITCSGSFNNFTGRYSHNIIVFASFTE